MKHCLSIPKIWWLMIVVALVMNITTGLVLSTAQGRLRGVSRDGFVSYLGIPYATISSPASRFKGAGLAPIWHGIRESESRHCSMFSLPVECLHLDVHLPSSAGSAWPVLVWVRGGSGQYNPAKLVQQGILVVIVSHRIGPLGFLCLKDENIPGNAGVKDVVLALRWVRDNIVAFRGNPYKVVVAGQGFGATMVEALMLSSMGDNLYHGAILQSGSVLSPWAFNYDSKARAKALARSISNNDYTLTLLNATIEDLVTKSDKLDVPYFPFGICSEKYFKYEELLINEPPYELLNKKGGSVPMIIGYNSEEAYIFSSILKQSKVLKRLSTDVSFLLPEELKFLNEGEVRQVARQIQDAYFKDNITIAAVLAYHRDAYFVSHVSRSVRRHATSYFPVFFYKFSHVGTVGVVSEPGVKKTGAAHSDELAYLFPDSREMEGHDAMVQENLIRTWTNFVKYLNPTPDGSNPRWEQVDPSAPRLLDIGRELRMETFPHAKEARMWDEIYEKFYYNRYRADTV